MSDYDAVLAVLDSLSVIAGAGMDPARDYVPVIQAAINYAGAVVAFRQAIGPPEWENVMDLSAAVDFEWAALCDAVVATLGPLNNEEV